MSASLTKTAPSRPDTIGTPQPAVAVRAPGLDRLRGLAVLFVLLYHAWPGTVRGGLTGVDIFFVLSGYLVTSGLVRSRASGRKHRWASFWVRRTRRLIPALAAALIALTAAALLISPIPAQLGRQWVGALTWSSNWFYVSSKTNYFAELDPPFFQHLWSLGVEAQFYLVWPVALSAIWMLSRVRKDTVGMRCWIPTLLSLLLAVVSAAGLVLGTRHGVDASSLYMNSATHLFGLMAGATVALIPEQSAPGTRWLARARSSSRAWPARLAITVLVLALCRLAWVAQTDDPQVLNRTLPLATGLAAVAVLVMTKLHPARTGTGSETQTRWTGILALGRVMEWLGQRSYAIYLWHWPLLLVLRGLLPRDAGDFGTAISITQTRAVFIGIVMMVLACCLAELSWHFIEEPVNRLGWIKAGRAFTTWIRGIAARPFRLYLWLSVSGSLVGLAVIALVLSPAQGAMQQQLGL
ncbi:acyltransferase [Galactobacter sp.]|mgnify:CR=1 FL=1|uniref:acyltransferase family protein n=1 Tax=Galactobacter sp. TaxID=2676125 RepID=UPI0025BAB8FC|nr:acyltransferase [Galactobacter sp.]